MNLPDWRDAPISKVNDREAFDCGEAELNEFLRSHARLSHEKGGAKTFVATLVDDGKRGLGFYSLSLASIDYARTPVTISLFHSNIRHPKNNGSGSKYA